MIAGQSLTIYIVAFSDRENQAKPKTKPNQNRA